MEYLDFVLSEVHGLRIKELQDAKAAGRKIIGTFCVFVPEELSLAADVVHTLPVPAPRWGVPRPSNWCRATPAP